MGAASDIYLRTVGGITEAIYIGWLKFQLVMKHEIP